MSHKNVHVGYGSGSVINWTPGSGYGSVNQDYGSADPDPNEKFMNPQHCLVVILTFVICVRGKVYVTEPSVLLGRLFME